MSWVYADLGRLVHYLLVAGGAAFLLLAVSNVVWLRRASRPPLRTRGPRVSVLIPARDEERNIGRCLDSLLRQSYESLEIIVVDDESSDRTWQIVARRARRHRGRLRALRGRPLPAEGWYGKPHAMQQLAEQARGEYLLFTDADTVHGPYSVSWAVGAIEAHGADFLSAYVHQEVETLGEALLIPSMFLMALFMPLWAIASTRSPALSFAIGQMVMFRRRAFDAIGGYASVSRRISEDIYVARRLKQEGFRTVFLDARGHVRCRPYTGFRAAFAGLTKNVYDFFDKRASLFSVSTAALLFFVALPPALVALGAMRGSPSWGLALLSSLELLLAWALVLWDRGQRWFIPLLYPLGFLLTVAAAWLGFVRLANGTGVPWKGRHLGRTADPGPPANRLRRGRGAKRGRASGPEGRGNRRGPREFRRSRHPPTP